MFCSNCGAELPENASFCPKCGVRTKKGREENVAIPWQDAFQEIGKEVEKAFSTAAKEIEKAFLTAREQIRRATGQEAKVCPNCGEKNPSGAAFCYRCGKKLA